MQAVASVSFALVVAAAGAAGPTALAVVVVVAALAALVDLSVLLGRAGTKPVLPVAVVPGLALPLLVVTGAGGENGAWALVGDVFAITVVGGFALVLVSGRRRGTVTGLGATFAAGLLTGLGAASVLLLGGLADGARWVLALAVLAAVADAATPAAVQLHARLRGVDERRDTGIVPVAATVVVLGVAAGALAFALDPPLTVGVAALFAAAVAVAALGGDHLRRVLAIEAGARRRSRPIGDGLVLGAVDAVLLAAPVAYVMARAAVV